MPTPKERFMADVGGIGFYRAIGAAAAPGNQEVAAYVTGAAAMLDKYVSREAILTEFGQIMLDNLYPA